MENLEVKKAIEDLAKTFTDFKAANDERLKEIEEKGHADPLLEEKVDKTNEAINQAKERLDSFEVSIKRLAKGEPSEGDVNEDMVAYKKGFDGYLRKGTDDGLEELQKKALSVGADPDGGYLVTPETSEEIIRNITETTPMRQLASVITIGSDAFEQRKRTSGAASGGWVAEAGTRSKTDTPKLGMLRIPVHEQYAEPTATQRLLDDASINVESWLASEIAEILQTIENTAFISGNGVGRPRGVIDYPSGTGDGQIEQIVSGAAAAITADGLIDLQDALKEPYQVNATWLMLRATVTAIRKLKDSQNQYLWQPGLRAGEPDILLSRPIVRGSDMPAIAANALAICYGDFRRGYKIVDRQGIRVLRDPYTDKPNVLFYTTKRVGGAVVLFEALKIQKIST